VERAPPISVDGYTQGFITAVLDSEMDMMNLRLLPFWGIIGAVKSCLSLASELSEASTIRGRLPLIL